VFVFHRNGEEGGEANHAQDEVTDPLIIRDANGFSDLGDSES